MSDTLNIKLLGKEYRVACAPDERESLQAAVKVLDQRMNDIATKTRSTGERVAVMTALYLVHEMLAQKKSSSDAHFGIDTDELKRRIKSMEARLDGALAPQEKLF